MKDKEFNRKLLRLVLPITLQYFMFALVPVADAVMLARIDQNAMSAVSLAGQVPFVMSLITYAIVAGASMLAAQYWGNKDVSSVEKLYAFSLELTFPVVLIFAALTFFYPENVIGLFTSNEAIIPYGAAYLKIASVSYIFTGVMGTVEVFMKNTGLVISATVASIVMVVSNIVLNGVFIYGFNLDSRGAAWGTVISSFLGFFLAVLLQVLRGKVHPRVRYFFSFSKTLCAKFAKGTYPVLLNQFGWGLGFTMISVIMGHLEGDAVAANSVVVVVKDLISCFCFALASGGSIMVGNELGAGNLDKGKEYGGRICKLALWSGIISGFVILFMSPAIIYAVDLNESASRYLFWMLVMCVYYMVGRAMNSVVISGIFCAGGDTKFGFVCDTITMWGFIVPLGALAAFVFKLPVLAVFFLLNLDEIVKLPVVYIHYKKYKWVRNLTE